MDSVINTKAIIHEINPRDYYHNYQYVYSPRQVKPYTHEMLS